MKLALYQNSDNDAIICMFFAKIFKLMGDSEQFSMNPYLQKLRKKKQKPIKFFVFQHKMTNYKIMDEFQSPNI